jgi:hypothetical protein
MGEIGLNELGYDEQLYILAFDHRGSFEKMVGGDHGKVAGAKRLIWEGFQSAVAEGVPKEAAGILVDGQYGPDVAREAKAGGYKLAMPVEKSGQVEFDFEYGDAFGEKIEEFDPDFSKVLVRYNPEGDAAMNERQTAKLRRLSEWLHEHHRKYLFELLVPAEEAQLAKVGGDADRYDAELWRRSCSCRTVGWRRTSGRSRGSTTVSRAARSHSSRAARVATTSRASSWAAALRMRRSTNGSAPAQVSMVTSASRSAARSSPSRCRHTPPTRPGSTARRQWRRSRRAIAVSSTSTKAPPPRRNRRERWGL